MLYYRLRHGISVCRAVNAGVDFYQPGIRQVVLCHDFPIYKWSDNSTSFLELIQILEGSACKMHMAPPLAFSRDESSLFLALLLEMLGLSPLLSMSDASVLHSIIRGGGRGGWIGNRSI